MPLLPKILVLLVVYQLKHFAADYPLQRPWMLGKFNAGWGFVLPLAAHCAVHATLTWGIVWFVKPTWMWPLAIFDFVMHFAMDRIKASPRLMGRWKPLSPLDWKICMECLKHDGTRAQAKVQLRSNRLFWHSIGFDQMVHHLTHYAIIAWLVWS